MISPDQQRAFQAWLASIGLEHCAQALAENGIALDNACALSDDDLRSCGLNLGDRRRFLTAAVNLSHAPAVPSSSPAPSPTRDLAAKTSVVPLAESRPLTVMFCDIVGSTSLMQQLRGEWRHVLQEYRKVCKTIVEEEYGGCVRQYLGDGVMAYFGWPSALEEHAERCIRAALEIVHAVKGVTCPRPLSVRIGIASGRVDLFEKSADADGSDGLAVGETPHLAERLQGIAKQDEVVIAPITRGLVGNAFDVTDLGVQQLKGFEKPIRPWRVVAVHRTQGRFDAVHAGERLTALVGRDEEVALLLRQWRRARSGEGQVVMLSGEAGIGKSRLTQVLRERLEGEAHTTLIYQCSSFRQNSALYPVIQQLEFAAGFARDDSDHQKIDKLKSVLLGSATQRSERAALFASLLSLPSDGPAAIALSPQRQKEKTLDELIAHIESHSRIEPVLIIFEDAHWIDPTSQELLDLLIPRLRNLRVLLVLTYRPGFAPSWNEYGHVALMGLTGLSGDLGAELVNNVGHGKSMPTEVTKWIIAHADGVPLAIEELPKFLLESGVLREDETHYSLLKPLPALANPDKLSASLIERLDRRPGVRQLARIGAAIGREFSYELLAALAPVEGDEFEEELEQLLKTGLVFGRGEPPDATYSFKHARVQEAAYESLPEDERPDMHARIVDVLETTFSDRVKKEPELLAYHHTKAGPAHWTKAIPLWRQAGEAALARVALQEGVADLDEGLSLVERLEPSPQRDKLEFSLRKPLHTAHLRWHGWASEDVRANAKAVLRLADSDPQPQTLLTGLWGMWVNTITRGRVEESRTWAERLLSQGGRSVDLEILGYRASMSSNFYLGKLDDACVEGARARALYESNEPLAQRWMELTGNDVRTAVGIFCSQALWMQGHTDGAVELSDQKDADSRRVGHPFDIGWALTWGSYVFDFRHEPERLLERVGEADRLAREQSIPVLYNILVPISEGLARLRLGELARAIALLRQGISGWTEGGGGLNMPYAKAALAEAIMLQGDLVMGLRMIEECVEQIERDGEQVWLPEVLRLKARMLLQQGKLADAESQLRTSLQVARRQQARSWELRAATTLAELLSQRGERAAARELLAPIYESFTEGFDTYDLKTARALLATLETRSVDAV